MESFDQFLAHFFVKLVLTHPTLDGVSLQLRHLDLLQSLSSSLRDLELVEDSTHTQLPAYVFLFQSVEDAVDFLEELKNRLKFSTAFFQTEDTSEMLEKLNNPNKPRTIQAQLEDQGYELINGRLSLNKQTSIQFMMAQSCQEHQDEQSTIVQSQRKTSIYIQQESEHHIENEQPPDPHNGKDNIMRPIFDGIMLTSVIFGGFKLFRYFVKM